MTPTDVANATIEKFDDASKPLSTSQYREAAEEIIELLNMKLSALGNE